MAKPIVFIKIPVRYPSTMREVIRDSQEHIDKLFEHEYHVLCFPTNEDEMEMQVFNDPNLTEANFDQLKEMVENALYDLKYPNNETEQELPGDQTT